MQLFLIIVEIKAEKDSDGSSIRGTMATNIFNDCRAENSFPASRYTMDPKKRVGRYFPICKFFTLDEPSTSIQLPFPESVLVIGPRIGRRKPLVNLIAMIIYFPSVNLPPAESTHIPVALAETDLATSWRVFELC